MELCMLHLLSVLTFDTNHMFLELWCYYCYGRYSQPLSQSGLRESVYGNSDTHSELQEVEPSNIYSNSPKSAYSVTHSMNS